MPTPFQIGQKLAQLNKPLPRMNKTLSPVQEQIKLGYESAHK